MSLYNLRSLTTDSFMIAKFDEDFNVEATYTLTASRNGHYTCDCPAGSRSVVTKPCRHRLMLPALLPVVDTDRFYDHDTGKFCEPLGDLADLRSEIDASASEVVGTVAHDIMQPVGEALRNDPKQSEGEAPLSSFLPGFTQEDTHTVIYTTDEPPTVYAAHRIVEAPPAPSAPTIRRR